MVNITQPLRDEHAELYRSIEALRQAADTINESLTSSAHDQIEQAYLFLTSRLFPHAQAEEKVLYPMVQKIMGSEQATATMNRDHAEVAQLTEELGTLRVHRSQLTITSIQARTLRRVLYSLYAILKLHFEKEEDIYLPMLDGKLTPDEARVMMEGMNSAYREAKERVSAQI